MRLVKMKLLAGQTGEITMTEFRQAPGDIIDQVQMGKTFTITKAGHVVAVLTSPQPTALELAAEIRRFGIMGGILV